MKKFTAFLLSFLVFTVLAGAALGTAVAVRAAEETDAQTEQQEQGATTPESQLQEIIGPSGLSDFTGRFHKLSSVEPGADIITSVIFTILDFLKYLLGAIAIIFMIISGFKLITSTTKIEKVFLKKKKKIIIIIF